MTAPTSPGQPPFAPAPGHTDEVLYAVTDRVGRVRLNRPRAINSLNTAMCASLLAQLRDWAQDDAVAAVLIDGAGEKGLCAGGDVRALRELILAGDPEAAVRFWELEYAVNALIADYPKPYAAWMDGVVMGGGVGVSAHGSTRLVTERSKVAMPETIIGFFPDVGGLYYLAHAPGELGTHVALTGLPVGPADAVLLGLADAVVPSAAKDEFPPFFGEVSHAAPAFLGRFRTPDDDESPAPASELEHQRGWIDECYAGDDAVQILRRLSEHEDPAARAAAEAIGARSPHSIVVTLEAIRRARGMTVQQVLAQDAVLSAHFAGHPDFAEGVRALLVDKDKDPRWVDASIADVDRALVAAAFGA